MDRWFDVNAFQLPDRYTFGTSGRNILLGDGVANVDLSIIRNFRIREGHRIQFRTELFNAFNHANFLAP